jgi:hypothetical protein
VHRAVRELLNVSGGRVEQLVGQVRERPRNGQLIADLGHFPVVRPASCFAMTPKLGSRAGMQDRFRPGTTLFVVLTDVELHRSGTGM